MRMRERYEEPVVDMISFGDEDIVTTSPLIPGGDPDAGIDVG